MDEEVAAFLEKVVLGQKSGRWHQQSLKRTLDDWQQSRPDDFDMVVSSDLFDGAVGYYTYPSGLGQYGCDTDLHFRPDVEEHLLDDVEAEHLVKPFYEDWMEYLQGVI